MKMDTLRKNINFVFIKINECSGKIMNDYNLKFHAHFKLFSYCVCYGSGYTKKKHCLCSSLRLNTIYVQTNSHFLANYFFICQNFKTTC